MILLREKKLSWNKILSGAWNVIIIIIINICIIIIIIIIILQHLEYFIYDNYVIDKN